MQDIPDWLQRLLGPTFAAELEELNERRLRFEDAMRVGARQRVRDFRLCGRVHHIGSSEFAVVASAICEQVVTGFSADVIFETTSDRASALARAGELVTILGARIVARGDRVIDVVVDD